MKSLDMLMALFLVTQSNRLLQRREASQDSYAALILNHIATKFDLIADIIRLNTEDKDAIRHLAVIKRLYQKECAALREPE